jgi:hypothetical protein
MDSILSLGTDKCHMGSELDGKVIGYETSNEEIT